MLTAFVLSLARPANAAPMTCDQLKSLRDARVEDSDLIQFLETDGVEPTVPECLTAAGFSPQVVDAATIKVLAMASAYESPPAPAAPERPPEEIASELLVQGMNSYRMGKTPDAKARFSEALAAHPGDKVAARAIAFLTNPVSGTKVGGWKLSATTDQFTEQRNVYATLGASTTILGVTRAVRPTLIARCNANGELDLFIDVSGTVVNSDYGEVWDSTGRTRVDSGTAETVTFGIGDDRDAVFFPSDAATMRTLVHGSTFLVEVSTYGRGDQAMKFSLAGADEVLPLVLGACGMSPS